MNGNETAYVLLGLAVILALAAKKQWRCLAIVLVAGAIVAIESG